MKDFFISYNGKDKKKAEWIAHQLEDAGYTVVIQAWDFRPGCNFVLEMQTAAAETSRTIAVLSQNYLDALYTQPEWAAAFAPDPTGEKKTLVPVRIHECRIKGILTPIQYIDLVDKEEDAAREALINGIKRERIKPEKPPVYEVSRSSEGNGTLLTELPTRKATFMGRDEELKVLAKKLKPAGHVLLVNGLGGIGKTELCKYYFRTHYQEYGSAAWVDYGDSLAESLARIFTGERKNQFGIVLTDTPPQVLEKVFFWLRNRNDALLVIDDLDNPNDPDLNRLFSLPCAVLVNSRQRFHGCELYELGFLDMEGCRQLFYSYYTGEKDNAVLEKIFLLCQQHTLTVELLARTAENAALSIADLLKFLNEKGFNLGEVIKDRVHTFWHDEKERKLFFQHLLGIFSLSGKESREELNVLTNLAVLPAEFIVINDISEWLKLASNEVINQLVSKGWLRKENHQIFMHHVIQEVTRFRRETRPNAERCRTLVDSLTWELKGKPTDSPMSKQRYMHTAHRVLSHLPEVDQDLATLANNLSNIYKDLGQLEKALEFQVKAINIREEILEPSHPDRAQSYNNLSSIYQDLGQLEKALEFQVKANGIYEEILEPSHPLRATSYNNLSLIYKDLGQLEKALPLAEKAVNILRALFPKGHPNLDTVVRNLELLKNK